MRDEGELARVWAHSGQWLGIVSRYRTGSDGMIDATHAPSNDATDSDFLPFRPSDMRLFDIDARIRNTMRAEQV